MLDRAAPGGDMRTKTCKACRTVNEDFAIVCRNCGARIGDLPQPGTATPAPSAPPPMPTGPIATDDHGFGAPSSPSSVPPPAPPGVHPGVLAKKSNAGIVIAFVAGLAVLGVVAVYVLTQGGGGLPDELAGHPRSDSEIANEIEEMIGGFDIGGVSIDVALYGTSEPVAMLMIMDGLPAAATDVPADVFFDGFASGFAQQQGLGIDPTEGIRQSSGGADFLCVDAPAEAFGGGGFTGFGSAQGGSFCVFKGETIGMVFLLDGTGASTAMPAVQQAYAEIA
jgi:hypothetical protein